MERVSIYPLLTLDLTDSTFDIKLYLKVNYGSFFKYKEVKGHKKLFLENAGSTHQCKELGF